MTKVIYLRVDDELHEKIKQASRVYKMNETIVNLLHDKFVKDRPPLSLRETVIEAVSNDTGCQRSKTYIYGYCASHPAFDTESVCQFV